MRIPDYRFSAPIKENHWSQKKRKVEKVREEEFAGELDEALHQKESKTKKKIFKPQKSPGKHISWV